MNLTEVISQVRKLNQPVPVPPRLPSVDEVESAESQLGIKFHEDYRQFLLEASDVVYGTLEPARVTPDSGHLDLVRMVRAAWNEDGVQRHLLPICHDNANYFCVSETGEVLNWDHNGPTDEKWPSLAAWIKQVWIEGG
jgi:hypothetical protein